MLDDLGHSVLSPLKWAQIWEKQQQINLYFYKKWKRNQEYNFRWSFNKKLTLTIANKQTKWA